MNMRPIVLTSFVLGNLFFRIILDLLKMNVSPQAVLQMLKTMCAGRKKHASRQVDSGVEVENVPPPRQRHSSKTRHLSGSSGSVRRESKR